MTIISKTNKSIDDGIAILSQDLVDKPYVATTKDVQITVWPEFIDSKSSIVGDIFIWAYHVRIDNNSLEQIKLVNRYWKIIDERGIIQEISGEGVIGEQPLIKVGTHYQYSSGVHLRYHSGIMTGHYQMQKPNGEVFNVAIPTFSLDVPSIKPVIN
jgi:ApaG protein